MLNKKETILAQQKQQAIKDQFAEWVWKDAARRDSLTKLYNEEFNSIRPREYDGSHIRFVGMTPKLRCGSTRQTPLQGYCTAATPC